MGSAFAQEPFLSSRSQHLDFTIHNPTRHSRSRFGERGRTYLLSIEHEALECPPKKKRSVILRFHLLALFEVTQS